MVRRHPVSMVRRHPVSMVRRHPVSMVRRHPVSMVRRHPVSMVRRHPVSMVLLPQEPTEHLVEPTEHRMDRWLRLPVTKSSPSIARLRTSQRRTACLGRIFFLHFPSVSLPIVSVSAFVPWVAI